MCQNNGLICELFMNHEERLKRCERLVCSALQNINLLQHRLDDLQRQVESITTPQNMLREDLTSRLNSSVTIQTSGGSVTGTLLLVGNDFSQVLEPSGDFVFILLTNVVGY